MQAAEISRTALDVEWRRLEVIAENLANANTARTATGAAYRAMRLISGPKTDFQQLLSEGGNARDLQGVAVYGEEPMNLPPRRAYEPGNPQADADGFVSYPGYDQTEQMTLLVKTERAYEANVVALNTARQMYLRAMEVGRTA
ncbi:MAG TPA: flagellar basal body rod protein FlgC [Caulobacteraceae bacterium]|jgi:flagellar basal-body rod protein FlgC